MRKNGLRLLIICMTVMSVLLLCACGKKPKMKHGELILPDTKEEYAEILENTPYWKHAISYHPDTEHLACELGREQVYVNNIFTLIYQMNEDNYTKTPPKKLLGAHLLGYDPITRKYLYEIEKSLSAAEIYTLCDQAAKQMNDKYETPAYCNVYNIKGFSAIEYDSEASALQACVDYLQKDPVYKYGAFIPDPSHMQVDATGEIYIDNAIAVEIMISHYGLEQNILELTGGKISGYTYYSGIFNNMYFITWEESKTIGELKTLCEKISAFNTSSNYYYHKPEVCDEYGQLLQSEQYVLFNRTQMLDYCAYLEMMHPMYDIQIE